MGFASFFGRLFFASIFILSAWQMFNDFGEDGGPAAKELIPKLDALNKHISTALGVELPHVDTRYLVAGIVAQKGLGGILFVLGSPVGTYLLLSYLLITSPILYDFYNYGMTETQRSVLFNEFMQSVALFGALLFFIGMKTMIPRRRPPIKKKSSKAKVG